MWKLRTEFLQIIQPVHLHQRQGEDGIEFGVFDVGLHHLNVVHNDVPILFLEKMNCEI